MMQPRWRWARRWSSRNRARSQPMVRCSNTCTGHASDYSARMRSARLERKTAETAIAVEVNLEGTGAYEVATGNGSLDHSVEQFCKHSLIELRRKVSGD